MSPDDPSDDEVCEIWNAMIDRKPAVIVQCAHADVVAQSRPGRGYGVLPLNQEGRQGEETR